MLVVRARGLDFNCMVTALHLCEVVNVMLTWCFFDESHDAHVGGLAESLTD